jgi:AcrR family transcriptional regulator
MRSHSITGRGDVSMRSHCYDGAVPRVANVEQQKASLAAATARLVARGGLEAVSLRSVAAEAGVSMGRVQHYFATKDDLLLDALQRSYRSMERRIEQRLQHGPGGRREVLVAILEELLAEDPETRDAIRINTAFAARALEDERIAAVLTEGDEEIQALAVSVVADARTAGLVGPNVDPELDGRGLFALATGLGSHVALYGGSPAAARATLHHHLQRVAPPLPNSAPNSSTAPH